MHPAILRQDPAALRVVPNIIADREQLRSFTWADARAWLRGLPGGGLNIAFEAVDRHVLAGRGGHVAIGWRSRTGIQGRLTYAQLSESTNRFANVLKMLGVRKGDAVFLLTDRVPELYVAVLGALKAGTVVSPLFSAFGPEPVRTRLERGMARVLVTTEAQYERKVAGIRAGLPRLEHVLILRDHNGTPLPQRTRDFRALLADAPAAFDVEPTTPDDTALLHFTSGTTGTPKGALHVHGAAVMHAMTARYALDLHPDDIFWCTADPGWVTGTSYGIIAPLLSGVTSIVDEGDFDADRWYRLLQERAVTVWYTAPTAIRMLMKAGPELARKYRFPSLRLIASVGEPLNPEAVWWGLENLGLPILDNWWQTETGGIMVANTPGMDIKPGSMGRPLPGVRAEIVTQRTDGTWQAVDAPGVEGQLALHRGWPSMFRGYLHDDERTRKCFQGDLYLTGDIARRDADGYFWFVGRADDVIKASGHLVGPFEVESVLLEHPAVAEAAVIGIPDPVTGELIKAFVALKPGHPADEKLRAEVLALARKRLGAAIAPKQVVFVEGLPRTRSGKIMRRLLRARELGLPEGDLSTLEGAP